MTPYHSQYWAHLLTLKGPSGSIANLSRSIANSRVDLNPHQVDAALFALRSPLSKGVILADEVGLGKTIEAGIVLAQKWAERHRHVLLIVPAILRKQWQQELEEKFYLPTSVLDSRIFAIAQAEGLANPFDQKDRLVICSYQFAAARQSELGQVPWDLVVIDEAHRLRNVFKASSKTANAIAQAIGSVPKLLLTATPLQNSLMELYGLVSVIDPHVFGDAASFREQFVRAPDEQQRNAGLRSRLQPLCVRTLRKQVVEYIPFTRRVPVTQEFIPGDDEHALYEQVSAYLQREKLIALPASQRQLITLVLRKLLASSTFAIASTLRGLVARVERIAQGENINILDEEDLEGLDELQEEWESEEADTDAKIDPKLLREELAQLRQFATLADGIKTNAKGNALLPALKVGLAKAEALGAMRRAIIFTESRRTQQYLFELLSANGYEGQLVLMNGTNADPNSKAIYQQWLARHGDDGTVIGSRAVDMKGAIVEHFKDHATILIATEAAAEGINLQFCSLVVNYDLPWNPQRVEQRIGRCHRYGQKHDVVVLNFLNKRNEADQRVFQLLSEKFQLFGGVFGASDEVLGALESGVDIERRIAQVYQSCRTSAEIATAFDKLQAELDEQIQARMTQTRETLLENFDEDVSARLRIHRDKTLESLSDRERWLLELTRTELDTQARFDTHQPRFEYTGPDAHHGWYHLDWKQAEANGDVFYRQDHPLAVRLIREAIGRKLPFANISLDYTAHASIVSVLKPLIGACGWLEVSKLVVESLESEEFLVLSAATEDGRALDEEICQKLLILPATVRPASGKPVDLSPIRDSAIASRLKEIERRNAEFFDEEVLKLDRWSDDLKQGLEREIKEIDKQIKEARRTAALAAALRDKLEAQKTIKSLESDRNTKRRDLFTAQDAIDAKRDGLIGGIEKQLGQRSAVASLFVVRWLIQ
ncbi:MAG: SNF2-related protein [Tepidisphaeraceae bacterium]|jgi:adenine-specific DNA-methyltransferase